MRPMAGPPRDLSTRFYEELKEVARRALASERRGHTLAPTEAVHEVCLRLFGPSPLPDASRAEHLALAARVLRQVLVDHHRRRAAEKRGGGRLRVELDEDAPARRGLEVDVMIVDDALTKLRALSERQAEVVTLKILGGLSMPEIADNLGVALRTVEGDWTVARAWLRREFAASGRAS
jgi:RNA polymerase sigma-70 factor (ECF subfamily)